MKNIYSEEVSQLICDFYNRLPERARRCYAGIESLKLGHGGIVYVSNLLKIDRKTVRRGRKEVQGIMDAISASRQRKAGGGRKKKLHTIVNFEKC
jgi:hypothetical protein